MIRNLICRLLLIPLILASFRMSEFKFPDFLNKGNPLNTCSSSGPCQDGLILAYPTNLPIQMRAVISGIALAYLLLGVSIITDRIVAATEFMANHQKSETVIMRDGNPKIIKTSVWHPVISGLTFEAIGTTSPEILIPLIEMFKTHFQGNKLGPSLIVGSGAYHLFIVTAVCLFSVRESSGKPIKDLHLFFSTASFALLAYLSVFIFLDVVTPKTIDIWEAAVTLMMYPTMVLTCWLIARRIPFRFFDRFLNRHNTAISPEQSFRYSGETPEPLSTTSQDDASGVEIVKRKLAASRLRTLRRLYPDKSKLEIEDLAASQIIKETPKKASFYRLGRKVQNMGIKGLVRTIAPQSITPNSMEPNVQKIGFSDSKISCAESCGQVAIEIERWGPGVGATELIVNYETASGTAKDNVNFRSCNGCCRFQAGSKKVVILIDIMDDKVYELVPKWFKVQLVQARVERPLGPIPEQQPILKFNDATPNKTIDQVEIKHGEMTVSILDDDHSGLFTFDHSEIAVPDNIGTAEIKVNRSIGSKGVVLLPYRIISGTALPNQDYIAPSEGVLHFDSSQLESTIAIGIVDKDRYGEVANFYIELLNPQKKYSADVTAEMGLPMTGNPNYLRVAICESEETKEAIDRLIKAPEMTGKVLKSSWKGQFIEALRLTPQHHSTSTYQNLWEMSWLLIGTPWRILVAFGPPPRLLHGWVSYFFLLGVMVVISALIGDCATIFGCTIGLKDTVTAVTLIPFGTGLPDTFASRRAAISEKTADTAIGSILSSNAISVFLGMGLSWFIGAVYQESNGNHVQLNSGNLGFIVILYLTFAVIGVCILLLRRLPPIRGELGGPNTFKYLSGTFFLGLWALFITLVVLHTYCIIEGF